MSRFVVSIRVFGDLPLEIVSVANRREHWAVKARRAKRHRKTAAMAVKAKLASIYGGVFLRMKPAHIRLIRFGRRRLDGDNLQAAFKSVRDGVADALGIDDGDPEIEWAYDQLPSATPSARIILSYRAEIQ